MKRASILHSIPGIAIISIVVMLAGCSKDDNTGGVTPPPTPPPVNIPTGEIKSFELTDTLVAFNTGTFVKWLVDATNNYTIVKFDSTKVSYYGVLQTGPVKRTTTYTLSVNNGKSASVTLKVADSVTTLLWNKGKRIRQTRLEYDTAAAGDTLPKWAEAAMDPQKEDERTYFTLFGVTRTVQSNANMYLAPPDGTFVMNMSLNGFTWKGVDYRINTLENDNLVLTYFVPQSNGTVLHWRNTYKYE